MSVTCVTYGIRELSQMLGVSMSTLYREVRSGGIAHVKVGARILIPQDEVEKLLAHEPQPKASLEPGETQKP